MVAKVSQFWVWFLHSHILLVLLSLCFTVFVLSVYVCLFSCPLCGMFLASSLFTLSLSVLSYWSLLWICRKWLMSSFCLLPASGWLLPSHYTDILLQICWWVICVSLFWWLHVSVAHSDSIASTTVFIWPFSYYLPMYWWPAIFSLHCYSWPCR